MSRDVAVWRNEWLPRSETFIRDQMASLTEWRPRRVGLFASQDPLVTPDHVIWPHGGSVAATVLDAQRRMTSTYRTGAVRLHRGVDYLRQHPVELIHAHFAGDAILAAAVARRIDVPLIVTCHGQDVTVVNHRPVLQALYTRELRRVFQQADVVVGVSEFLGRRLLEMGVAGEKLVTHYIGVPVVQVAAAPERGGICFVGRLMPKKGVADLLDAVGRLPDPYRATPITVVGDGPLRQELEDQALSLGLRVHFAGLLPSDEIPALLRRHVIFAGPSQTAPSGDSEGFGLVFLEAALQELPVVSYRHGGVPEAVVDGVTGLLADERDVDGLSRALLQLLKDPGEAETMGRAGRARVEAQFDVRARTEQLERIYDQLV